ncbi:acyl-CoA thioesterase [Litoribacter ruber]|uniref:Acyl-CoA thioesterase n=1 Tax=Litoribacter ruber TaxID=702568 RepID=A0AAP2CL41_9BACT|nr:MULTISPECIES: thioesterase family protein [Litoribacter]MBS9523842.1 acyl-CoA thioesterase [Litoribacter alkaliphilus]MBT0811563.1 acyl-CoA thioesterase [Litoribacter ruber]
MFTTETQVRVRYAETDQMGYVYYGNYAAYYEVGRVEAMRNIGFSYKKLEEQGIMMPALENYSRYYKPGRYDELLTIKVEVREMPGVRIRFDCTIINEAGEVINEGYTLLTFIRTDNHRPCRPPKDLLDLMRPYY